MSLSRAIGSQLLRKHLRLAKLALLFKPFSGVTLLVLKIETLFVCFDARCQWSDLISNGNHLIITLPSEPFFLGLGTRYTHVAESVMASTHAVEVCHPDASRCLMCQWLTRPRSTARVQEQSVMAQSPARFLQPFSLLFIWLVQY
jgi:hypothetical protein